MLNGQLLGHCIWYRTHKRVNNTYKCSYRTYTDTHTQENIDETKGGWYVRIFCEYDIQEYISFYLRENK